MKSSKSKLRRLIRATSLPFGGDNEGAQVFTPAGIVSGFIAPPRGASPLEAAWHAAAVALDSERIRLVHREADGGIYFLAADSGDFVGHPNAMTPLASALPGAAGHKGDGAYLIDIGSGLVGVAVKEPRSLRCYVGERNDALRFAGESAAYWPEEGGLWTGFRQYESWHARRLANRAILIGMTLAAVFLAISIFASAAAESLAHQRGAAIDRIRAEQQATALRFGSERPDAYAEYRKLAVPVVTMGGQLTRFESAGGKTTWEAEFPSWVEDLSSLGSGLKTKMGKSRVIVSK